MTRTNIVDGTTWGKQPQIAPDGKKSGTIIPANEANHGLDELDVKILRELEQGRYTTPLGPEFGESFRAIAKKKSF